MFFERFMLLCGRNKKNPLHVLRELGLKTSSTIDWGNGTMPDGNILLMLANYFHVSTDYLLGNAADPRTISEQTIETENKPTISNRSGRSVYDAVVLNWFHSLPPEKRQAILCLGDAPKELIGD